MKQLFMVILLTTIISADDIYLKDGMDNEGAKKKAVELADKIDKVLIDK